jgi:hypothetical protein
MGLGQFGSLFRLTWPDGGCLVQSRFQGAQIPANVPLELVEGGNLF